MQYYYSCRIRFLYLESCTPYTHTFACNSGFALAPKVPQQPVHTAARRRQRRGRGWTALAARAIRRSEAETLRYTLRQKLLQIPKQTKFIIHRKDFDPFQTKFYTWLPFRISLSVKPKWPHAPVWYGSLYRVFKKWRAYNFWPYCQCDCH